jgi:mRNA (guanine-N7-)-methyltransferase
VIPHLPYLHFLILLDNMRPDVGVVQRLDSPIIGLKNFNNWVKSVLITRFAHPILAKSSTSSTYSGSGRGGNGGGAGKVLDMGIGKGGDLTKWAKAKIRELIGAGQYWIHLHHAQLLDL